MRYPKEQINEKFQKLPSVAQGMILSSETGDVIKEISSRYNLQIDTVRVLNEEITFVLIGIEKSSDFIRNIKAQSRLPDEKINAIAKDVNEKIFLPVLVYMKTVENLSPDERNGNMEFKKESVNSELPPTEVGTIKHLSVDALNAIHQGGKLTDDQKAEIKQKNPDHPFFETLTGKLWS